MLYKRVQNEPMPIILFQNLKKKYQTVIGERGVGISGGQRQRIALARALAVRPSILVLDDTTSAVDIETETYIQSQLEQLDFICTKIIIAQRVSSVQYADCIYILTDGTITESGTHKELMAQKGYYYETYMLQNGDAQADYTKEYAGTVSDGALDGVYNG